MLPNRIKFIFWGVFAAALVYLPRLAFNAEMVESRTLPRQSAAAMYSGAAMAGQAKADLNRSFAEAMAVTMKTAGTMAQNIGSNINLYVQQLQLEKKQRELLSVFYERFYFHARNYMLTPQESQDLKKRVEDIYFRQALETDPEIDLIHFSDMRHVIKKALADMVLEQADDGAYETYYLTGETESLRTYKEGKPHGTTAMYSKKGDILFIDTYKNGFKINRKKYGPSGVLEFSQDYPYLLEDASPSPEKTANNTAPQVQGPQEESVPSAENKL